MQSGDDHCTAICNENGCQGTGSIKRIDQLADASNCECIEPTGSKNTVTINIDQCKDYKKSYDNCKQKCNGRFSCGEFEVLNGIMDKGGNCGCYKDSNTWINSNYFAEGGTCSSILSDDGLKCNNDCQTAGCIGGAMQEYQNDPSKCICTLKNPPATTESRPLSYIIGPDGSDKTGCELSESQCFTNLLSTPSCATPRATGECYMMNNFYLNNGPQSGKYYHVSSTSTVYGLSYDSYPACMSKNTNCADVCTGENECKDTCSSGKGTTYTDAFKDGKYCCKKSTATTIPECFIGIPKCVPGKDEMCKFTTIPLSITYFNDGLSGKTLSSSKYYYGYLPIEYSTFEACTQSNKASLTCQQACYGSDKDCYITACDSSHPATDSPGPYSNGFYCCYKSEEAKQSAQTGTGTAGTGKCGEPKDPSVTISKDMISYECGDVSDYNDAANSCKSYTYYTTDVSKACAGGNNIKCCLKDKKKANAGTSPGTTPATGPQTQQTCNDGCWNKECKNTINAANGYKHGIFESGACFCYVKPSYTEKKPYSSVSQGCEPDKSVTQLCCEGPSGTSPLFQWKIIEYSAGITNARCPQSWIWVDNNKCGAKQSYTCTVDISTNIVNKARYQRTAVVINGVFGADSTLATTKEATIPDLSRTYAVTVTMRNIDSGSEVNVPGTVKFTQANCNGAGSTSAKISIDMSVLGSQQVSQTGDACFKFEDVQGTLPAGVTIISIAVADKTAVKGGKITGLPAGEQDATLNFKLSKGAIFGEQKMELTEDVNRGIGVRITATKEECAK
jgi:hypothetical protein